MKPLCGRLAGIGLLLFLGCSTFVEREQPNAVQFGGVNLEMASLCEALLERKGVVLQSIAGSWKDHPFAAEVVMKGTGDQLKIVFMAPQMRLATITLTKPHRMTYEPVVQIPRLFEPEYALVDLALINLDAETLRRTGGGVLAVEETGRRSTFIVNGKTIAYLTKREDGSSLYENVAFGYSYVISH